MLKTFLTSVLNQHMGNFFDISEEQLSSIKITGGKICLENVPLKRNCLRQLRVPFRLRSGNVQRLTVMVPVAPFLDDPVYLKLENTTVYVESFDDQGDILYHETVAMENRRKLQKIQENFHKLLLHRKVERRKSSLPSTVDKEEEEEELPVTLDAHGVKVVYEDVLDDAGRFKLIAEIRYFRFKNFESILGRCTKFRQWSVKDLSLCVVLADRGMSGGSLESRHRYVDVSEANIRLHENTCLLSSNILPERSADIYVKSIRIDLVFWSLRLLRSVLDKVLMYRQMLKFVKFRPSKSVSQSPKEWWRYAVACLFFESTDGCISTKPSEVLRRARNMKAYCPAYIRHLKGCESNSDRMLLDSIEMGYSFEDVSVFRYVAINNEIREVFGDTDESARLQWASKASLPSAPGVLSRLKTELPTSAHANQCLSYRVEPFTDLPYVQTSEGTLANCHLRLDKVSILTSFEDNIGRDAGDLDGAFLELLNASAVDISIGVSGCTNVIFNRTLQCCTVAVNCSEGVLMNTSREVSSRLADLINLFKPDAHDPWLAYVKRRRRKVLGICEAMVQVRLAELMVRFHSDFVSGRGGAFCSTLLQGTTLLWLNNFRTHRQNIQFQLRDMTVTDCVNRKDIFVIRQIGYDVKTASQSPYDDGFCRSIEKLYKLTIDSPRPGKSRAGDAVSAEDQLKSRLSTISVELTFNWICCTVVSDVWLILVDFVSILASHFVSSDRSWRLNVDLKNDILELEMPYVTNGRSCGRLRFRESSFRIALDKVSVHVEGRTEKVMLRERSELLLDDYPVKSEYSCLSHQRMQFTFLKFHKKDDTLARPLDGRFTLKCRDPIFWVHTNRLAFNLLSMIQDVADSYAAYCQLREGDANVGESSCKYGFRLQMEIGLQQLCVILPTSATSPNVLIFKINDVSVVNRFELRPSPEGQNDMGGGRMLHLIESWKVGFKDSVVLKAFRIDEDDVQRTFVQPFGDHYKFEIHGFLSRPALSLQATFTRHLCQDILCQVNELDVTVSSKMGKAICLYPDALYQLRCTILQNIGENVLFPGTKAAVDKAMRAVCAVQAGTRITIRLDCLELRFPIVFLPGDAWSGSVAFRDVQFCYETCTYAWSELNCSFFITADEIQHKCEEAASKNRRFVNVRHSLTPGTSKFRTELRFRSSCGSRFLHCAVPDLRFILLPAWIKGFSRNVLVSLLPQADLVAREDRRRRRNCRLVPQALPVAVKISFINCQFIFAQQPLSPRSLAVGVKASGSVRGRQKVGTYVLELVSDSVEFFVCELRNVQLRRIPLSNPFSLSVQSQLDLLLLESLIRPGARSLPSLEMKTWIRCSDCCLKLSLGEWVMLRELMQLSRNPASSSSEDPPVVTPFAHRVSIEAELLYLIIAEDDGFRRPMLRLLASGIQVGVNLNCDQSPVFTGCGSMKLAVDFYNQSLCAWDPLLENMQISSLSWQVESIPDALSLDITSLPGCANLTVMESHVKHFVHIYQNWSEYESEACRVCRRILSGEECHEYCRVLNHSGLTLRLTRNGPEKKATWTTLLPFQDALIVLREGVEMEPYLGGDVPPALLIGTDTSRRCCSVPIRRLGMSCHMLPVKDEPEKTVAIVCRVTTDANNLRCLSIRSNVQVHNCLPYTLQLCLSSTDHLKSRSITTYVDSNSVFNVPVSFCTADVCIAVHGMSIFSETVDWKTIASATPSHTVVECSSLSSNKMIRFVVFVRKLPYLLEKSACKRLDNYVISVMPVLSVVNLLPEQVDVVSNCEEVEEKVQVPPDEVAVLLSVTRTSKIDLMIRYAGFASVKAFVIDLLQVNESFVSSLPLFDEKGRLLVLSAVCMQYSCGFFKIFLKGHFIFINRSGLPLIVKQDCVIMEAAGQSEEDEEHVRQTPLLFSFSQPDSPQRCCVRIGKRYKHVRDSLWCDSFSLARGIAFRDLQVRHTDGSVRIFHIGMEMEYMSGHLSDCLRIVFTSRYFVINKTKYVIAIRQSANSCPAKMLFLSPTESHSWHLPFPDRPPLMSIKVDGLTHWTEDFLIDCLTSFVIYLRGLDGIPVFLNVEIILNGSTYTVKFTSANHLPPAVTVVNMSSVPISFIQTQCKEKHMRTLVESGTSCCYNWDSWINPKRLQVSAYEATSADVDLYQCGQSTLLSYNNPFYVVFETADQTQRHELAMEASVVGGRVFLGMKTIGKKCQLWTLTPEGQLVNVGLSLAAERDVVLDLENVDSTRTAPFLCTRKAQSIKHRTQYWVFNDEQSSLHMMGKESSRVFVRDLEKKAPVLLRYQALAVQNGLVIRRCPLRPGTGTLAIEVISKSPSRVLLITDEVSKSVRNVQSDVFCHGSSRMVDKLMSGRHGVKKVALQWSCFFHLSNVGISVVNDVNEELVYCLMDMVSIKADANCGRTTINLDVHSIQCDNQLRNSNNWQLLKILPVYDFAKNLVQPAITFRAQFKAVQGMYVFEHLSVSIGETAVQMDEILLWKMACLLGLRRSKMRSINYSTGECKEVIASRGGILHHGKCYFDVLRVTIKKLYLSVIKAHSIPKDLMEIKRNWNVPLVGFQNASVHIIPFQQNQCIQSLRFLFAAILRHFDRALRNQAMKILGSFDFLGNPLGLFRELSGGVHELVVEGNLSGFIYGLWHGLSNSAAKFTSALSAGVGIISMDGDQDDSTRIRYSNPQTAVDHIVAGVRAFGVGIFGGMTSLVVNMVDGAVESGFEGMLSGIGRGLVGTVAKPMQGILDLACGAASAAKETASKGAPLKQIFSSKRIRPPRTSLSFDLTLPQYDKTLSEANAAIAGVYKSDGFFSREILAVHVLEESEKYSLECLICLGGFYVCCREGEGFRVQSSYSYEEIRRYETIFANKSVDGLIEGAAYVLVHLKNKETISRYPTFLIHCGSMDAANQMLVSLQRAHSLYNESLHWLVAPNGSVQESSSQNS